MRSASTTPSVPRHSQSSSLPEPQTSALGESYRLLEQMARSSCSIKAEITGFLLSKEQPSVKAELNGYELDISLDSIFGSRAEAGYGLIVAVGPDEFLGAGRGFRVAFTGRVRVEICRYWFR